MISKRKFKRIIIIIVLVTFGYQIIQMKNLKEADIKLDAKDVEIQSVAATDLRPADTMVDYYYINERNIYETEQIAAEDIKFILILTGKINRFPFAMFTDGNTVFVENECDYTNCYITHNKSSLNEDSFDMIAFNSADLQNLDVPEVRSSQQKYAFFSIESPQYNPVCYDIYDDFFNWTFTYKLNSDFRYWFFDIYDANETVIGPPVDVWPDFEPIDDDLKSKLDSKTKIAAWFVSNCETMSAREVIAENLNKELKKRYDWTVDVYGHCGKYACPRRYAEICNRKIEDDYFFYLAFENSFAEDYVTEKILLAFNNYAVPIVYGGANYSRFLPPDSYLDIKELGVPEVARLMHKAYTHREYLYDYFKWMNFVSYRHISRKSQICKICSLLNDNQEMTKTSIYPEFRTWWNNEAWENNICFIYGVFGDCSRKRRRVIVLMTALMKRRKKIDPD